MNLIFLTLASSAFATYSPLGDTIVDSSGNASLAEVWGEAWPFQGINTFAHMNHEACLVNRDLTYDIGIIGVPFDTATSYRPGARFGPRAIRAASQRQTLLRGYNARAEFNPYDSWATIMDCGDIPVTPMDNQLAFKQMTMAFEELIMEHRSKLQPNSGSGSKNLLPRYVALGGDHSVILPHLRALHKVYGPINVIHFDAHLDTWKPDKYPSFWHSTQGEVNHGSMLWKAFEEGLISQYNVHAGIRTKLSGPADLEDDDEQNWTRIFADDIWVLGVQSVIKRILQVIPKDTPTYISVDIDVLDPGFGSGTGTQEPGGWLPRELIYVLRGIEELSLVGADIVEVSPAFDHAEITATNGAQVAYEIITSMVKKGPLDMKQSEGQERMHVVSADSRSVDEQKLDTQENELREMMKKLRAELKEVEMMKSNLRKQMQNLQNLQVLV